MCTAVLTAAGFGDISVSAERAPFWMGSAEEYVRFARDVLPPATRQLLCDWLGSAEDPRIWRAVTRLAGRYATADGRLALTSDVLCLRAVAPDRI
jgi:hypothetical protein